MGCAIYLNGTQRACAPAETWRRIEPLLPVAGIIRVADVTRLDDLGIPTWQAIRPAARTLSVSQGKGLDDASAKVSAAMEALELWHAEDLSWLPSQVHRLGDAPCGHGPYTLDTEPGSLLNDDTELAWLPAYCLRTGDPRLLPRAAVALDAVVAPRWHPPGFRATSNGLASGNTRDEALLHGLLEVIERHRLARAEPVPIDPAGVPDDHGLIEAVRRGGSTIELYDVPGDDDLACLPCVLAVIRDPVLGTGFHGAGCHLDAGIAVCRAVTEAAQSRLSAIAGTRDDIPPTAYTGSAGPPPALPAVPFSRLPSVPLTSIEEELTMLADLAPDAIGADLSHPALGVAVVKVVVPGMAFSDTIRAAYA